MTEWSMESEWQLDHPYDDYQHYDAAGFYPEKSSPPVVPSCSPLAQPIRPPPPSPALQLFPTPPYQFGPLPQVPSIQCEHVTLPRGYSESPRDLRNLAEKQRRDKFSQSISQLANIVPPVVAAQAAKRKVDKTGVLRLTAHYLRAHHYVFGDSIGQSPSTLNPETTHMLLSLLKGFLITTTYKGIIVVASQNVQDYLGYSELDLLGQKIQNLVHPEDCEMLLEQLKPKCGFLGPNGELKIPEGPDGKQIVTDALASEKRTFTIRFLKLSRRLEPAQYLKCVVEGNFRQSDGCKGSTRCRTVRRSRARGVSLNSSGNDIVFIGLVRPMTETFMTESHLEAFRMEYRTRHSVDGEIIQVDHRISLVTGYMAHEVNGVNAMNFMHRDDVRWVIFALRDMYDQNSVFGESCYRLVTKNGEFIYMRTQGMLDVDEDSRAVRSFVCTNTQVEEEEGKALITTMKERFMMMVGTEAPYEENNQISASPVSVEDPKELEKVILDLVTNLPSPQSVGCRASPQRVESPGESLPLAIIPPERHRIVSAIEKIYGVINVFNKKSTTSVNSPKPQQENPYVDMDSPIVPNCFLNHPEEVQAVENLSIHAEDHNDKTLADMAMEPLPECYTFVNTATAISSLPEPQQLGNTRMYYRLEQPQNRLENSLEEITLSDDLVGLLSTVVDSFSTDLEYQWMQISEKNGSSEIIELENVPANEEPGTSGMFTNEGVPGQQSMEVPFNANINQPRQLRKNHKKRPFFKF